MTIIRDVQTTLFGDRFEQQESGFTVVGEFARFFSGVVVAGAGLLETLELWVERFEIFQIIDPVSAQAESVANELTPNHPTNSIVHLVYHRG